MTPNPVRTCGRADRQAGSVAVELTLLSVPLVVLLLLIASFGRLSGARLELATVAGQAARAASVQRDPATATAAARRTAHDALTDPTAPTCDTLSVTVDITRWRPGGAVTVTLGCRVNLADLAPPGTPQSRLLTARAIAPIDLYRGLSVGFTNSEVFAASNLGREA
ncbi:MAG: pilus assembly protein [Sporichthyaceae bacterium]|nr:pilus assembly protein [Sporichthyaceae bacterium]